MDLFDRKRTVGSIAADYPEAAAVFKEYNIDFRTGGSRLLSEAAALQGIDETELFGKLARMQRDRSAAYSSFGREFDRMTPAALSAYIEDIHHSYLRIALPQIAETLTVVLRVHGREHMELYELYSLFGRLRAELEQHLLKEESLLFPALLGAEEGGAPASVTALITKEHEEQDVLLRHMRLMTNDYSLPPDAGGSWHRAYEMLMHLESDLKQHVRLENSILSGKDGTEVK